MSKPAGGSPFSAADPALGYLYQIRSALLWALRRLRAGGDFQVSIETLDDVTFETADGDPSDLLQTKHHRGSVASLTNASPDLWKTLRIWIEGRTSGQIPLFARLCLVTTGTAPVGSAAARLRAVQRDVGAAQAALAETAASSTNATNRAAYELYLGAPTSLITSVLDSTVLVDAAPTIDALDDELRGEVYWAAGREHVSSFLERLEGWWFRRVLVQLTSAGDDRIGSVELEQEMSELREQFKRDALPIDDDLLQFMVDEETAAPYLEYRFVRQLEIISIGQQRVRLAIQDYYRAYTQRSRWLRQELVVGLDVAKYEQRLTEEWTRVFEAMRDELGDAVTEEAKQKAARAVLGWADGVSLPIRPAVTEPFVCRGSFHMLADDLRVGWHPEFKERLAHLLLTEEAVP